MFSKEVNGEMLKFYTCKVTDFNSAHMMKGTDTYMSSGTEGFAAPELTKACRSSIHTEPCGPSIDNYQACDVFRLVRNLIKIK